MDQDIKNRLSQFIEQSNLLRVLKPEDLELLLPHLQPMAVKAGTVLCEAGAPVRHAHFPCGSTLVSFMVLLEDARAVETALIGREGAVGGIVSQGRLPAYCRAVVQFPGHVLRIDISDLERAKAASPALQNFFTRYADCLLAQIFQAVACNATHTIEQRAAKWIMAALERTGERTIPLTHEQVASMLGVGRSYVGRILGDLKARGTLETLRGKMVIHKREDLKRLACQCNDQVKAHFDDVLANIYPTF